MHSLLQSVSPLSLPPLHPRSVTSRREPTNRNRYLHSISVFNVDFPNTDYALSKLPLFMFPKTNFHLHTHRHVHTICIQYTLCTLYTQLTFCCDVHMYTRLCKYVYSYKFMYLSCFNNYSSLCVQWDQSNNYYNVSGMKNEWWYI